MNVRRAGVWSVLALALAVELAGAQATSAPARPRLPAEADTNSWLAYYTLGLVAATNNPRGANEAFYWASRLDPTKPEPLYGRWVTFLGSDGERLRRYLQGDHKVVDSREVAANDTLLERAMLRDPFMPRSLERPVFERAINGAANTFWFWMSSKDPFTQGMISYMRGDMTSAADAFGRALTDKKHTSDSMVVRFYLAHALYQTGRYDSTARELTRIVEGMRARERKKVGYFYQSKAHIEYGIGLAYARANDHERARDAFSRALVEDLSFYMAHARLAEEAMALGDTATALLEHGLAVELGGDDPITRYAYGAALLQATRYAEALEQLRIVIAREPYFAAAYAKLALAEELRGQYPDAVTHYTRFVELAPRTAEDQITFAKSRIEELQGLPAITLGESQ